MTNENQTVLQENIAKFQKLKDRLNYEEKESTQDSLSEDELKSSFSNFLLEYLQLTWNESSKQYELFISENSLPIPVSFSDSDFFTYFYCESRVEEIEYRITFVKDYIDFIKEKYKGIEKRPTHLDLIDLATSPHKIKITKQLSQYIYRFILDENNLDEKPSSKGSVGETLNSLMRRTIFFPSITTSANRESFKDYIARMERYSKRIEAVYSLNDRRCRRILDFCSCTDEGLIKRINSDSVILEFPWLNLDDETFRNMENPFFPHYKNFLCLSIAKAVGKYFPKLTIELLETCTTEELENIYSSAPFVKMEKENPEDICSSGRPCDKFLYLSLEHIIYDYFPNIAVKQLGNYSKQELKFIYSSNDYDECYKKFLCVSTARDLSDDFPEFTVESFDKHSIEELEFMCSSDNPYRNFLCVSIWETIRGRFPEYTVDLLDCFTTEELKTIHSFEDDQRKFLCVSIMKSVGEFPGEILKCSTEELEKINSFEGDDERKFLCLYVKQTLIKEDAGITIGSLSHITNAGLEIIIHSPNDSYTTFLTLPIILAVKQCFPKLPELEPEQLLHNFSREQLKTICHSNPHITVARYAKEMILGIPWSPSIFGGKNYQGKRLCEGASLAISKIDAFINGGGNSRENASIKMLFQEVSEIFEPRQQSSWRVLRKKETADHYKKLREEVFNLKPRQL